MPLTREEIEHINLRRFARWTEELTHHHATGAVMVGIGHDDARGQLHIVATDDFSHEQILGILAKALVLLQQGRAIDIPVGRPQ